MILFGKRRQVKHGARHVDPLVVRQRTADDDARFGPLGTAFGNA